MLITAANQPAKIAMLDNGRWWFDKQQLLIMENDRSLKLDALTDNEMSNFMLAYLQGYMSAEMERINYRAKSKILAMSDSKLYIKNVTESLNESSCIVLALMQVVYFLLCFHNGFKY